MDFTIVCDDCFTRMKFHPSEGLKNTYYASCPNCSASKGQLLDKASALENKIDRMLEEKSELEDTIKELQRDDKSDMKDSIKPNEELTILNAEISNVFFGKEDHGMFVFGLDLACPYNTIRHFGNYEVDAAFFDDDNHYLGRTGTAFGMNLILNLLETIGVETYERLPGTMVRLKIDRDNSNCEKIVAIGHIIEEKWFYPEVFWQEMSKKSKN